jgi:O-succinylbenzoate synthase
VSAYQQPNAAAVLIIKPAVHRPELFSKETSQRKVVTANLAHPIEQISAAYAAALIDPTCCDIHGLLSHRAYCPNRFSPQLNWRGPLFTLPTGTGVGFVEELAAFLWEEI